MIDKIFTSGQMIYDWLSKFATTYRGVLPAGENPEDVYLRFDGYFDNFADEFILPVLIYKTNTTSYASVLMLADKLESAIGDGGIVLGGREMKIKIDKGSPFYQDRIDEDETVRAGYVNLRVSIYAVTAATRYKLEFFSENYTESPYPVEWHEEGEEIRLPACSYRQIGYAFKGWRFKDKVYSAGDTFIMPAEDVAFWAEWEIIVYVVNFVADDVLVERVEYTVLDMEITPPAVPYKDGFVGYWQNFALGVFKEITVKAIYVESDRFFFSNRMVCGRKVEFRRKSA